MAVPADQANSLAILVRGRPPLDYRPSESRQSFTGLARSAAANIRAADTSTPTLFLPVTAELGRDQFVVPDLAFKGAFSRANRLMCATISSVIVAAPCMKNPPRWSKRYCGRLLDKGSGCCLACALSLSYESVAGPPHPRCPYGCAGRLRSCAGRSSALILSE